MEVKNVLFFECWLCVKNIPFPKREAWFILGDIIQAHKFPVERQKAVQQGVKI